MSSWKTSNTSCASPQCSAGVLVADNLVDFSAYPARDACKVIGGRLPTEAELACISSNKTNYNTYGDFVFGAYWSATEYNAGFAWGVYFGVGSQDGYNKTVNYNVRCVRGQ